MNQAQFLMLRMGVDPAAILLAHHVGKSRSHTRKGPGRVHQQGPFQSNKDTF